MSSPVITLPTAAGQPAIVIDDCLTKLRHFVEKDAYVPYDHWITTREPTPPADAITWDHVYAINNAMRARSPRAAWEVFVDKGLPELAAIPLDLDLIDGPDAAVTSALDALAQITRSIAAVKGLTDMAGSKILYLLRPKFVAISDSYVRQCLGIPNQEIGGPQKAHQAAKRMLAVQEAMRALGRANGAALTQLGLDLAATLPSVRPTSGEFAGKTVPVTLSKVRILDILLWSHVAIHGATPHPDWLKWHQGQAVSG